MKDKTLYEMILEKLGVEDGEKFNIVLEDGSQSFNNPFYFYNGYLFANNGYPTKEHFAGLIRGELTIEKLHWKPKEGDAVYGVLSNGYISMLNFACTVDFLARLKCEWLFKTKEEAEANKERVLKEMREVLSND